MNSNHSTRERGVSRISGPSHLRAVPDAPTEPTEPRPDLYAYEHEQRRRIARRDWAGVHIRGDRNQEIELAHRAPWKRWFK